MVLPTLDAQLSLRTLTLGHFVFASMAMFGSWIPLGYLFYNCVLLIHLHLAQRAPPTSDSGEPLLKCLLINGASVLFDLVVMIGRYHFISAIDTFALVAAVLHLLFRLGSCFVLWRIREQRLGLQYGSSATSGGADFAGGSSANVAGYEEFPPNYGPTPGVHGHGYDSKPLPP